MIRNLEDREKPEIATPAKMSDAGVIDMDWLAKWKLYSPSRIAIKNGLTSKELSYFELYQQSCRGAAFLKTKFNLNSGDRVVVVALNEISYVILFFSLQRLGVTIVPVNYRLTRREVEHVVSDCKPKLLIYDKEFESILPERNSDLSSVDENTSCFMPRILLHGPNSFAQIIEDSSQILYTPFDGHEKSVAMIIYTSGTTGAPKGAMITNSMIFWNSLNTTLRLNISQNDCAVIFLPFFHTGAWNVLTTPFLHRGAKLVFINKFDAESILSLSQNEKATLIFGVPTTMAMMANHPVFESTDLTAVRYAVVGGEAMPLPLIEKWHKKGLPVRQGYGLTEFGPNVFSLNEEDALRKIGSIGFPNFYVQTKIVNEHGEELQPDGVGELMLKGPMCMAGYWNNSSATNQVIVDGWLSTGDLAYKDSEGYHYIVGRKKDMFKSGGENVYPTEIENVLLQYPDVVEAAVIGVPDAKWGEVGKAFVVRSSQTMTSERLYSLCCKDLAKFKVPKYFEFLDALPKGDSGKILKRVLQDRERLKSQVQVDPQAEF